MSLSFWCDVQCEYSTICLEMEFLNVLIAYHVYFRAKIATLMPKIARCFVVFGLFGDNRAKDVEISKQAMDHFPLVLRGLLYCRAVQTHAFVIPCVFHMNGTFFISLSIPPTISLVVCFLTH
jgi:hypothetical protein